MVSMAAITTMLNMQHEPVRDYRTVEPDPLTPAQQKAQAERQKKRKAQKAARKRNRK